MFDIILGLISIILLIIFLIFKYPKNENFLLKFIYTIVLISMIVLIVIYYMDLYNIPSLLGWNKKVDSIRWFNFITSYFSTIVAQFIGSIFIYHITIYQINKNKQDMYKRDCEERRINNMPLLEYSIDDRIRNLKGIEITTLYDNDSVNYHQLHLKIKNIGMNSVKKCYIKVDGNFIKESGYYKINSQCSIAKNEEKMFSILIDLPKDTFKIKFCIYYEDMLNNWYYQEVTIIYSTIDDTEEFVEFEVGDEKLINDLPKLLLYR